VDSTGWYSGFAAAAELWVSRPEAGCDPKADEALAREMARKKGIESSGAEIRMITPPGSSSAS